MTQPSRSDAAEEYEPQHTPQRGRDLRRTVVVAARRTGEMAASFVMYAWFHIAPEFFNPREFNRELRMQKAVARKLKRNERLSPSSWREHDEEGRTALLQEVADTVTRIYAIPSVTVVTSFDGWGHWVGSDRLAMVPAHKLHTDDRSYAINTALHELRHAIQDSYIQSCTSLRRRLIVRSNSRYVRPQESYTRYWLQPSEIDARDFGARVAYGAGMPNRQSMFPFVTTWADLVASCTRQIGSLERGVQ